MSTLVVIGDVHGNARALKAALDRAHRGRMDRLVFVGDLLTYGHDVHEVIQLVSDAQLRDRAVLLVGNHDRLYFDLQNGQREYYETLPTWIQESVDLTCRKLGTTVLWQRLDWSDEYFAHRMLVSHANPFGPGDSRYLADDVQCAEALAVLRARGVDCGIFGHTHRPRWRGCGKWAEPPVDEELSCGLDPPLLVNVGAVGQPRGDGPQSVILRLSIEQGRAVATFESISYDVEEHVAALRGSGLSTGTVERLCNFFTRDEA